MKNNIIQFPRKEDLELSVIKDNEDTFECIRSSYKDLKRSTDPSKKLNLLQKQLLDLLTQLTKKTGQVVIDYPWLQEKLDRSQETVRRTLHELSNFFSFQFHQKLMINNKVFSDKIVIDSLSLKSLKPISTSCMEAPKNMGSCPQKRGELSTKMSIPYIEENTREDLKKDRSSESSFSKNSKSKDSSISITEKPIELIQVSKPLSEYHPLTDDEVWEINKLAGKEECGTQFSTHFVNQLMLELDKKKPTNSFETKQKVFKYLAKALLYEMRSLDKANNNSFRFKISDEQKRQERYLKEVEDNRDTSLLSQLRRKIAGRFDDDLSYQLLKSCDFPDVAYGSDGEIYKITMNTKIELTDNQKGILLEEVRAVYGNGVESIEFVEIQNILKSKAISTHQALTQNQTQAEVQTHPQAQTQNENKTVKSAIPASLQPVFVEANSIWHNIRERLKQHFGEAIYLSWFGKLEPEEHKGRGQLTLKAPTHFIKDWIKSNYQDVIEQYCQLEQYKLVDIIAR